MNVLTIRTQWMTEKRSDHICGP